MLTLTNDSKKIVKVVEKNGGEAILTSTKHKNGTERIGNKRFYKG